MAQSLKVSITGEPKLHALVYAVDNPPSRGEQRIIEVPGIRQGHW